MRVTPLVAVVAALFAMSSAIAAGAPPSTRPTKAVYLRIAEEVEANLQKEILDKWFPVAVDQQGGGFFEDYALDWSRGPGSNKSIVYQSRLTWTSAEAARRFPAKAGLYLAMTRRGAACLAEKLWDKQSGGFFWTVGPNGQPITSMKQTYGHAFGIYALATSYRATKDLATLELAKKAFAWLEDHAHDNVNKGYFNYVGPDGKPTDRQKAMNPSIHILEALTALYEVWPDALLKTRVEEMLDVCREKIYFEPGYLVQFLTEDWQRNPKTDSFWQWNRNDDSFGHDVEAGFLMVEAAEVIGKGDDARNWTAARHLVDHAMQYGWDKERGGLYDSGTMNAQGVVTGGLRTEKIWWVEAEHLNALLLQHEHVGKETAVYWDAFIKQWDWITKYQLDHAHGGWWPTVEADGTPASRVKSDTWTECYHQGRAMLNVSARLRKLAAQEK